MRPDILKNLIVAAALALSPALLAAQGVTENTTSQMPNSDPTITSPDEQALKAPADQATPFTAIPSDAMAYQRELEACDRQPADRDTCRAQVDQRHINKGSTMTPGQSFR